MVLLVPIERFAAEARVRFPGEPVYVAGHAGRSLATVGSEKSGTMVQAEVPESAETLRARLEGEGLEVARGRWVVDEESAELDRHRPLFVAAVAYRSSEGRPGLWVDAYHREPSAGEVIDAFFDEMRSQGQVGNVTQEEFERIAGPTVVVVAPDALQEYANQSEGR
jgi:hypothetical protein